MIEFFETTAPVSGDGKRSSSWIQQDVIATINETQTSIKNFPVSADQLGQLLKRVSVGEFDNARGRDVFQHLLEHRVSVAQATKTLGIEAVDGDEIETLCQELLASNPQVIEDVRGGKIQAVGALIGQAKNKNPNANPQQVRETLLRLIGQIT